MVKLTLSEISVGRNKFSLTILSSKRVIFLHVNVTRLRRSLPESRFEFRDSAAFEKITDSHSHPHRKELESVEEAERYLLDYIGVSSSERGGSGTVDLDGGWKLFYSGAEPSKSAQAGVGIFTSPRLLYCVSDWISSRLRVCMLKLKGIGSVIVLIASIRPQCYTSEYLVSVDEVNGGLLRV